MDDADPADWLRDTRHSALFAQPLHQANGYAVTLLWVEAPEEEDISGDRDRDSDTNDVFGGSNYDRRR